MTGLADSALELGVLLYDPGHLVDDGDRRGIAGKRRDQSTERVVPILRPRASDQPAIRQRRLRYRGREVRPLGRRAAASGRLEDHVRPPGAVTELLNQA
jgi:hypothetical protein